MSRERNLSVSSPGLILCNVASPARVSSSPLKSSTNFAKTGRSSQIES
ncbi:hypothetical protein ACFQ0H_04700 [Lysobacter gummosus]